MAMTVTVTQGGATFNGMGLQVLVLTGATEAGGKTASAYSGTSLACSASLTPNFSASYVAWALVNDATVGAPAAATSNAFFTSSPFHDTTNANYYSAGHYTGTVTGGTALTAGSSTTEDGGALAVYEIPASGTIALDGSTPAYATTMTATLVTTASFTPPAGAVLVVIAACDGSGSGVQTESVSDTSGLGLTWTQRVIANAGTTTYQAAIFTTTVPASSPPAPPPPQPAVPPGRRSPATFPRQVYTISPPPVQATAVPAAETAGAADALAVTQIDTAEPDPAGAVDALSVAVAAPLAEVAGATDGLAEAVAETGSDAAGATEALSVAITAAITLADTAGAVDVMSPAAAVPLSETAGAADTIAAAAAVPLADTAGAADSPADATAAPLAEAAGAAEAIVVVSVTAITEGDVAGAADTPSVAAAVPLADPGAAADKITATAAVPLAETAGAVDALSVSATGPETEAGAATDALTATVTAPLTEAAGAIEGLSVAVGNAVSPADTAGAIEAVSLSASTPVADQAGAADQITASASVPLADPAGGVDQLAVIVGNAPALPEAAGAVDALSVAQTAAEAVSDVAGAADNLRVTVAVQLAEQAASVEVPAGAVAVGRADTAAAVDVLVVVSSTARSGTVCYRAQPEVPRWLARPASRWAAQAADPRWAARPAARWSAQPARPRWRAMLENFTPIPSLSLEEINVRWTADLDGTVIDPTTVPLTVQYAFPVSSGNLAAPAQPVTWFTGSWLAGGTGRGYVSQCLVGSPGGVTVLAAGSYDVWSKITGSPESPVRFVGVQTVY